MHISDFKQIGMLLLLPIFSFCNKIVNLKNGRVMFTRNSKIATLDTDEMIFLN